MSIETLYEAGRIQRETGCSATVAIQAARDAEWAVRMEAMGYPVAAENYRKLAALPYRNQSTHGARRFAHGK